MGIRFVRRTYYYMRGALVKKFVVAAAAIAAFGFVNSANAADMPVKAPLAARVAAPAYNWTGLYVGGVVGYGWAKGIHCGPFAVGCLPETDPKGWNGGVTLGYNYQWTNWVFGVEGDWSWADMRASSSGVPGLFFCPNDSCVTKIKSFETARARVGWAFDRFLPYVTAGAAWTQLDAAFVGSPASGSTTKTSFVVGGGVEYAFWQNVSAKVEYLYISRLGDFTYDTTGFCGTPGCFVHMGAVNEVRLGLNWRFTHL
jgi:outer membrane immunogenic protein